MIHAAVKWSKAAAAAARARTAVRLGPTTFVGRNLRSLRLIHGDSNALNANPVATQMINYALSHARSQKSDESYAQGMLVLEQCLSNQSNDDQLAQDSKGMVLLAMSDLLCERGNSDEAIERLKQITCLKESSFSTRVVAVEALVGLHIQSGQDEASSAIAEEFLELLKNEEPKIGPENFQALIARAKAIKGLSELVKGSIESAASLFRGLENHESCQGNVALSYGEFFHATGNYEMAKEMYQKAIKGTTENKYSSGSCNMNSQETSLAATFALGQLQSHVGNFADAEETLTSAVTKAEEYFGHRHQKVGVILTGIALMYRKKAKQERSSSFLIQEGLYRRSLELMKAPPLDSEGYYSTETNMGTNDAAALARGGYAELLCIQENRKSEGEKMKAWAYSAWRNRRLSLSEALNLSEPSGRVPILDARTARII
ncbi:PREDICTED: uncharacterized protein LOC104816254 [Tarenaya hassleriana]|uniref:uncharacterized protein LOC104816254 n=1 Tax=Tarenaya hassleriana TaxID=28532 RepID=UPI00053C1F5C|nr:PREDICTED: uncharacterized protein LOC104816254 [Tarenaya hassleriana]